MPTRTGASSKLPLSRIDILRKMRQQYRAPDDVIEGLLSQLSGQRIPRDPAKIHGAVYRLTQHNAFRELLKDFRFDTSGLSPFSHLLDRVLTRLEMSGILCAITPKSYALSKSSKSELLNTYWEFSAHEQELIRKMSMVFTEKSPIGRCLK